MWRIAKTLLTAAYIFALDLYGWAKRPLFRLSQADTADAGIRALAGQLADKGYVILEDYCSVADVEALYGDLQGLLSDEAGDYDHINRLTYYRRPLQDQKTDGGVFRLWRADAVHPLIDRFRRDSTIKAVIEQAFATQVNCFNTIVQKNLPTGSTTRGFHIDIYAPREFKAFLFLTDVCHEDHGPFAIIEGSHKWHIRRLANYLWRGLANRHPVTDIALSQEETDGLAVCKVKKGCVVISCQQAVHRGWPLVDGERVAVVNYYLEKLRFSEPDFSEDNRLGYGYAAMTEK